MIDVRIIAIVDDDPSILKALRRLVQSHGYTVATFASAREFLDAAPRCHPDCLVLDVHLNGTGFELQERLRADGMTIPVIFITGDDDQSTRHRVEAAGAAAHLLKPVDERALIDAIHRVLARDVHVP